MFKKLNDILLSKYPLLWNTRIVHVLATSLCVHILFYLAGFLYPITITQLWEYRHFNVEGVITFSGLISAVIIIIWLSFYLRNNPFKSFYTLGRNYLFYEFGLIFIVFFSSATFFLTYKQGFHDNVMIKTNDVDLKEDADKFNLAMHFVAFNKKDFDVRFCCDSLEAKRIRDSIRIAHSLPPTPSIESEYYENDRYRVEDTLEYEISYLHYCQLHTELYSTPQTSREDLNDIAARWLTGGKKDSVTYILKEMVRLCNKYGVELRFPAESHAAECFNDDRFTVQRVLETNDRDYNYFINTSDFNRSIHRIEEVRGNFWNSMVWITLLYYALGCAIILFSFRATRLKHWFMAIIGIGLWCIIVPLIIVSTRMNFEVMPEFILVIWICVLIPMVLSIKNKSNKLMSGILYNWSLWVMPFVIPLIAAIIEMITDVKCYEYSQQYSPCPPDPPINVWINNNWDTITLVNMAVIVVVMYFAFIPLARKWQSNPEE